MKYKHNYVIDAIFAVILIAVIGYALKGTLSHMDEVRAAEAARAATETVQQTEETQTETKAAAKKKKKKKETEAAVTEYEVVGGVNFRGGPSGDAEIIDTLADGDVVELIDKDNSDWWHVRHEDMEGYVYAEFLQEH